MGFMGNNPYNLITRRIRFTDFTLRREHIKREHKKEEKRKFNTEYLSKIVQLRYYELKVALCYMMYIFNIIEIEELSIGDDGNPMIWTRYLEEQYLETYYCSMY